MQGSGKPIGGISFSKMQISAARGGKALASAGQQARNLAQNGRFLRIAILGSKGGRGPRHLKEEVATVSCIGGEIGKG